jgi:23S rRNA (uracil1939-C5)-methyltransferase
MSQPVWSSLPESCASRPPCPGCPRYGDPRPPTQAVDRLEELGARLGWGLSVEVHAALALGYRHRVRLSVRNVRGRARLGIFEEGSHRLVPMARCPLHHPTLIHVAEQIEALLETWSIAPYDETAKTGLVRAVQLCAGFGEGRDAGRVQVTFVVRESAAVRPAPGSPFRQVLEELRTSKEVQSVWVNLQDRPTNTLLGPNFELFAGEEFLQQECEGALNFFPPGAFGQSHPALHAEVVRAISRFVPPEARVVEYHAGVGSIGLALAAREGSVASLVANEVNPHGLRGLERGVRALPHSGRVQIAEGEARAHRGLAGAADVVIVDPPRKGLEPELLRALIQTPPGRIIYLSCGLDALLGEAEQLFAARLVPVHIAAYPYFPFTDHVETLMVWER